MVKGSLQSNTVLWKPFPPPHFLSRVDLQLGITHLRARRPHTYARVGSFSLGSTQSNILVDQQKPGLPCPPPSSPQHSLGLVILTQAAQATCPEGAGGGTYD